MKPSIWSKARHPRAVSALSVGKVDGKEVSGEADPAGIRSIFQQDYDRLLFSTPVRRLSDKTQVWPMDENDGVRTRLTHSHEVANLARSIGTRVFVGASRVRKKGLPTGAFSPDLVKIGRHFVVTGRIFGHSAPVFRLPGGIRV